MRDRDATSRRIEIGIPIKNLLTGLQISRPVFIPLRIVWQERW